MRIMTEKGSPGEYKAEFVYHRDCGGGILHACMDFLVLWTSFLPISVGCTKSIRYSYGFECLDF